MTYMLDTNICIYAIKKRPEEVINRIIQHRIYGLCISAITLAELEHGVAKSDYSKRNAESLAQFMSLIKVLPFTANAAKEYGRVCADLQRKGTPIGTMDMLIAAHAKSEGLTIVTHNTKEFERVDGLAVEDWY